MLLVIETAGACRGVWGGSSAEGSARYSSAQPCRCVGGWDETRFRCCRYCCCCCHMRCFRHPCPWLWHKGLAWPWTCSLWCRCRLVWRWWSWWQPTWLWCDDWTKSQTQTWWPAPDSWVGVWSSARHLGGNDGLLTAAAAAVGGGCGAGSGGWGGTCWPAGQEGPRAAALSRRLARRERRARRAMTEAS